MAITKQALIIGAGATTLTGGGLATFYLLSKDETIKKRLISQGEKLINEKNEYQAVFKEFKDEKELTNLISKTGKAINSDSSLEDGGKALEQWCNEKLETPVKNSNAKNLIKDTKKYCTKPPLTVKDKYLKKGKQLVKDWGARLEKIKPKSTSDTDLLNDLKAKDPKVTKLDQTKTEIAKVALESWCNENIIKNLSENSIASIWTKVNTRCLEDKPATTD